MQTHAGTAAPFNFNGLVRHSYLRAEPELGDVAINLAPQGRARPRQPRHRARHPRAPRRRLTLPPGTSLKVVEPPPGPPVLATLLAEIYGPDAETRRAVAAQGARQRSASVPFIVDVDDSLTARRPAGCARRSRPTTLEFFKVEERDVFDTIGHPERRPDRRLFAPRRRPPADPDPRRAPRRATATLDERFLTTPIPANVLPGDRGVVELGDVVRVARGARLLPDLPPQRPRRRDGDGRTGRRLRGAALRHARRARRDRRPGLGRAAEARDHAARPARGREPRRRCSGTASGR